MFITVLQVLKSLRKSILFFFYICKAIAFIVFFKLMLMFFCRVFRKLIYLNPFEFLNILFIFLL